MVHPTQVVIIEGILILASPALRRLLDISFFVESRADTRLARRITRDVKERGRTAESVIQQFQGTVQSMYEQWVAPTKNLADFIISGEKWPSKNALEFIFRGVFACSEEKAVQKLKNLQGGPKLLQANRTNHKTYEKKVQLLD